LKDKYLYGKILDSGELMTNSTPIDKISKWNIFKDETLGAIPGTPYVTLTADKEVINYIIGK